MSESLSLTPRMFKIGDRVPYHGADCTVVYVGPGRNITMLNVTFETEQGARFEAQLSINNLYKVERETE